jgi:hypothetical protein
MGAGPHFFFLLLFFSINLLSWLLIRSDIKGGLSKGSVYIVLSVFPHRARYPFHNLFHYKCYVLCYDRGHYSDGDECLICYCFQSVCDGNKFKVKSFSFWGVPDIEVIK